MENKKIKLFLVHNNTPFINSLQNDFFQYADLTVETYSSGEKCLENLSRNPNVIILDFQIDEINKNTMNSIDTMDQIKAINPDIPIVMLSSYDKIDVAKDCMHHLAFDYVVKSETTFIRLQKIITSIIKYKKMEKELNWYMERM